MRLVRTVEVGGQADDGDESNNEEDRLVRNWQFYVRPRAADEGAGSWSATVEQELQQHLDAAERQATRIADALRLQQPLRTAVVLAAKFHDLGKDRRLWQAAMGNHDLTKVLAKTGHGRPPENLSSYRHEFGSLIDVTKQPDFTAQPKDVQDLILHLIAAHHGRARPHFPDEEAFDPEGLESLTPEIACETLRRYARLQRKFGRWGLAWLESLVRSADALASDVIQDKTK
jgi:CRISPR-associated endonuclease/helicase Cas3